MCTVWSLWNFCINCKIFREIKLYTKEIVFTEFFQKNSDTKILQTPQCGVCSAMWNLRNLTKQKFVKSAYINHVMSLGKLISRKFIPVNTTHSVEKWNQKKFVKSTTYVFRNSYYKNVTFTIFFPNRVRVNFRMYIITTVQCGKTWNSITRNFFCLINFCVSRQ